MSNLSSPADFLAAAYTQLEFDRGALVHAARGPQPGVQDDWIERGDWQFLADEVGAERIFFVDRDPVVVFAQAKTQSAEDIKKIYERIWCMSRPQLLFLASPGELRLLDLTKPPPRPEDNL